MKIEKMKQIVEILENSTLETLEITEGADILKISKSSSKSIEKKEENTKSQGLIETTHEEEVLDIVGRPEKQRVDECIQENDFGKPIKSIMVGVFYEAMSPTEEPLVKEGDTVEKGQVVCIIEAMKLMNEITSSENGTITKICVKNGDTVEYGQPLFYVK